MPILDSEMTYQEMQKRVKNCYICAECQAYLSVSTGYLVKYQGYILRCTNDVNHTGIMRPAEINNYDQPGYNMPGTVSKKEKELTLKYGEEKTRALVAASGGNVLSTLTEERATEIIKTIWPGAPMVEVKKAAIVCQQYGLNPLMKHLYLIPFNCKIKGKNGQPDRYEESYAMVMGIKASRIIARRAGAYSYLDDTPRFMTVEEQVKIFGKEDRENICAITRLKDNKGNTSIGTGKWPHGTSAYGSDKGNTPLNMAMIRSERQALDRLFPDSLPESQDVVDERYQELPTETKTERVVDIETGDIIDQVEGEFQEVKEQPPTTSQSELEKPGQPKDGKLITDKQKKAIIAILGDEKKRNDLIFERYGLANVDQLTISEASDFIKFLNE
jgi:hypothetical protein